MRWRVLVVSLWLVAQSGQAAPDSADAFARLAALTGDWQADLPGFGRISDSLRLVSNGSVIEETIGTAENNETSIYSLDGDRLLLSHFCALTRPGHVARLESAPLTAGTDEITLNFRDAVNLPSRRAAHMRRVVLRFLDKDHFDEAWTKSENGKDVVFDLKFARVTATQ